MQGAGQRTVICYVGVGANLGDPAGNCLAAMDLLASRRDLRLVRRSSLYRSEPVGVEDQPWFVNAVAEIATGLSARELLAALLAIESGMGRIRENRRGGPRPIDLDLLLYGQEMIREEGLIVPHPELHKRRFVLAPLAEIAPYVIHPAFGVSVRGLMDRLEDDAVVEVL
ncbi:MAG TPA: 2-amino-4-hydroxy-6-hydroxymethyldihydropteridine diphosphokinase [Syntrophales bacterium]|nr:2-amino-4-hydroxy-6-hydroxymethyldihydropteridine diphosphokinase [Syntrophales bacterium]